MADLATRVVVTGPWVVHHSSVYSSRLCPVTRLHEALFHFCSTVRLHTPLFLIRLRSAPRSGPLVLTSLDSAMSAFCSTARLLDSTRLALRAFLFYLLRLAATLFTHTLSHAWCPVTLLSLTCCPTVVVTVVAASCGRARDSMGSMGSIGAVARCVVAARLPPSAISVTVQHRITVQCSAMQCTVQHRSALHRRIQQMVSVS